MSGRFASRSVRHFARRFASRSAFTLVELLVVISIIGILMGLSLPAIQAARESARRTSCQNNSRQMGVALQSFHSVEQAFPWGGFMHPGVYIDGKPVNGTNARGFAWSVYCLPFLEQQNLYDEIDFEQMYSMGTNEEAAQTRLSVFVCPSARKKQPEETLVYYPVGKNIRTKRATYGLSHYGGIYGERIAWEGRTVKLQNSPPRGTLLYTQQVALDDVRDGAANTLIVGEDTHWTDGQWISSYNVMDQSGAINDPAITENEIRSDHSGGANVIFCDGHVEFLTDGTSLEILAALCTRDSGEIISR